MLTGYKERRMASRRLVRLIRASCAGASLFLLFVLNSMPAGRTQSVSSSAALQAAERRALDAQMDAEGANDPFVTVLTERRLRALNTQRQKLIVADTDKLLELAKELNDEIAKSKTGAYTPAQLHKIAEIEKLARNVKTRMANGVNQPERMPMMRIPPGLY